MRRFDGSKQDAGDQESGAPADRRSGVRIRGVEAASGDGPCASLEEVVTRHGHEVVRRILERLPGDWSAADDISQTVFIALDRRIRALQRVPHPVRPVLAGLTDDALRNHLRAEKRRRIDGAPDSQIPASKPDPEQLLDLSRRAAQARRVRELFARLDPGDAALLQRYHFDESSLRELALESGVPEATVGTRLRRARLRLARLFNLDRGPRRKT